MKWTWRPSRSGLLNIISAFADCAILLPLLVSMEKSGGMSGVTLLWSTGTVYLVAGLVFRVPMSVQPLKSIAIAGVLMGATAIEIRWSGFLIGLICLLAWYAHVDRLATKVPETVIQSVQFSLGLLLILQGVRTGLIMAPLEQGVALGLFLLMIGIPFLISFPILGFVATFAVFYGTWKGGASPSAVVNTVAAPRMGLILALVLPQLALTSANSVLGTRDVARRYFGVAASRVTVSRLLVSIGIGNMISALIGGLPFCHGSGGVTAHVRGGASHWSMNIFAGVFFIVLAGVACFQGGVMMPPVFVSSLLAVTGVFHLILARPMLRSVFDRWELVTAGVITFFFQNLLITLAAIALFEFVQFRIRKSKKCSEVYL